MFEDYIWLNGKIVQRESAVVSVLSPTAQFGLNVFEGIRCYSNHSQNCLYAFRFYDHILRLYQSCRLLGIKTPFTEIQILDGICEVISANNLTDDLAIRATIFGSGIGSWSSSDSFGMFIAPSKRKRTDLKQVPQYSACVTSWERINDNCLPPRAKVGANYINGRYAQLQSKRDGYDLPIFLGVDRRVSEGAGACIFLVKSGKLVTPTVTSSILESITRETVISLASDLGITVESRQVDRTELYLADEIFLCGSAAEISPITSVDRFVVGDGLPGAITRKLLEKYIFTVSGNETKYVNWLVQVRKW